MESGNHVFSRLDNTKIVLFAELELKDDCHTIQSFSYFHSIVNI